MNFEIITKNDKETIEAARNFIKMVAAPKVICLKGDLGAGKTTFSKGIAQGLEINEIVTSPTYTILNEYAGNLNGKEVACYHFDMYRLKDANEARELGFEEYFNFKTHDGIVIVEWAENVEGLIPKEHIQIDIDKIDDNTRKIIIQEIK